MTVQDVAEMVKTIEILTEQNLKLMQTIAMLETRLNMVCTKDHYWVDGHLVDPTQPYGLICTYCKIDKPPDIP